MINTVVFDLDDTIYNEVDYCRSGFAAVAHAVAQLKNGVNQSMVFDALWEQFCCGNRTNTFNAALDKLGIGYDCQFISKLVEIYRRHKPDIALPEESRKVLKILSEKYNLALLTDGYLPAQRLKVAALGIEKYFKCIIFTEELGREFWKPSPVGFEKVLSCLGVQAGNCVYVGDNELKDFIAPNRLGFATICIRRDSSMHSKSPEEPFARANRRIESLSELLQILPKL
ncbi:MAG: HAD family hydrolase [Planctomycetota bacterium]